MSDLVGSTRTHIAASLPVDNPQFAGKADKVVDAGIAMNVSDRKEVTDQTSEFFDKLRRKLRRNFAKALPPRGGTNLIHVQVACLRARKFLQIRSEHFPAHRSGGSALGQRFKNDIAM